MSALKEETLQKEIGELDIEHNIGKALTHISLLQLDYMRKNTEWLREQIEQETKSQGVH